MGGKQSGFYIFCLFILEPIKSSQFGIGIGVGFFGPRFLAPILPLKVTLSHTDRGRKKASPTPKTTELAELSSATALPALG